MLLREEVTLVCRGGIGGRDMVLGVAWLDALDGGITQV